MPNASQPSRKLGFEPPRADPGLLLFVYTAEPGSKSAEALNLLGSWEATAPEIVPGNRTASAACRAQRTAVDLCTSQPRPAPGKYGKRRRSSSPVRNSSSVAPGASARASNALSITSAA